MRIIDIAELHRMIGLRVRYRGRAYTVLEILDDGPAIVIQADNAGLEIQPDTYGYARRQVCETLTIPTLAADGTELHPDFLEITLA